MDLEERSRGGPQRRTSAGSGRGPSGPRAVDRRPRAHSSPPVLGRATEPAEWVPVAELVQLGPEDGGVPYEPTDDPLSGCDQAVRDIDELLGDRFPPSSTGGLFVPMEVDEASPSPPAAAAAILPAGYVEELAAEELADRQMRNAARRKRRQANPRRQLTADDYVSVHLEAPRASVGRPRGSIAAVDGRRGGAEAPSSSAGEQQACRGRAARREAAEHRRVIREGCVFGGLESVPTDSRVDPPPGSCFRCWRRGHTARQCPRPRVVEYCRNCGRRGINILTCPRCGEAHARWLRARYGRRAGVARAPAVVAVAGEEGSPSSGSEVVGRARLTSRRPAGRRSRRGRTRRERDGPAESQIRGDRGLPREPASAPPLSGAAAVIARRVAMAARRQAESLGLPPNCSDEQVREFVEQRADRLVRERAEEHRRTRLEARQPVAAVEAMDVQGEPSPAIQLASLPEQAVPRHLSPGRGHRDAQEGGSSLRRLGPGASMRAPASSHVAGPATTGGEAARPTAGGLASGGSDSTAEILREFRLLAESLGSLPAPLQKAGMEAAIALLQSRQ